MTIGGNCDILSISAMKKRSRSFGTLREGAVGASPRGKKIEVTLERCRGREAKGFLVVGNGAHRYGRVHTRGRGVPFLWRVKSGGTAHLASWSFGSGGVFLFVRTFLKTVETGKLLATFLFDTKGAKRKVIKRETPRLISRSAEREEGFALPTHKLLKKLDQNFYQRVRCEHSEKRTPSNAISRWRGLFIRRFRRRTS